MHPWVKTETNSFAIDRWFVDIIFAAAERVYATKDATQYALFIISERDRSQELGERFVQMIVVFLYA